MELLNLRTPAILLLSFLTSCSMKQSEPQDSLSKNLSPQWQAVGPFLLSPREAGIDHLISAGGEARVVPDPSQRFPSLLAPKASVSWQNALESKGIISLNSTDIDWDLLQQSFGKTGLGTMSYFYREIKTDTPKTVLIKTKNVHHFYINSQLYFGEDGNQVDHRIPVQLNPPSNRVLVAVTSYGPPVFEFSILEIDHELEILESDVTSPDFIKDSLEDEIWIGVPIQNRGSQWVKDLKVEAKVDNMYFGSEDLKFEIAPRSTLKFPLKLKRISNQPSSGRDRLELKIYHGAENTRSLEISIRERGFDQAARQTFLASRDGSAQEYSIRYPKSYDPKQTYALIVALHGAHVTHEAAIQTYAAKDWAFVVAPSDRRALGSGWRGAGADDVFELIEILQRKLPIRKSETYLAGHSMGGHGVWDIGLHHPERFAGLSPSAAWSSRERYIPEYLQSARNSNSPDLNQIRDRMQLSENTPARVWNALQLPIFSTHAQADPVVNILHQNLFLKILTELNYRFSSKTIDSQEHWCKEPLTHDGGYACVDHPDQWTFLRSQLSPSTPKHIRYETSDLSIGSRAYWLTITKQERAFWPSKVEAYFDEKTRELKIQTSNVTNLELRLPKEWRSPSLRINWNGSYVSTSPSTDSVIYLGRISNGLTKSPSCYGGISRAFSKPFLLVVRPDDRNENLTRLRLHQARLLSERLWVAFNAFAPIIFDRDIPRYFDGSQNLIFLGPSEEDSELNKVLNTISRVELEDYAIISNFPRQRGSDTVIAQLYGKSVDAQSLIGPFIYDLFREQSLLPDFLIFNSSILSKGWSGISIAGFYSPDWKFSKSDLAIDGL